MILDLVTSPHNYMVLLDDDKRYIVYLRILRHARTVILSVFNCTKNVLIAQMLAGVSTDRRVRGRNPLSRCYPAGLL